MLSRVIEKMNSGSPARVVCYGDSISEVGRTPGWFGGATSAQMNWGQQLWSLLLERYPRSKFVVENFGIGGQNAYEGLGRFDWLKPFNPDLVLIEFGANDCGYHPIPPEASALAVDGIINASKVIHGADAIVLAPGGDNPLDPFMQHYDETYAAMRKVAQTREVPFADIRAAVLAATENGRRWTDFHNGSKDCHPNDKGMKLWAATVMATIENGLK